MDECRHTLHAEAETSAFYTIACIRIALAVVLR